jgi:hypothetical protein
MFVSSFSGAAFSPEGTYGLGCSGRLHNFLDILLAIASLL